MEGLLAGHAEYLPWSERPALTLWGAVSPQRQSVIQPSLATASLTADFPTGFACWGPAGRDELRDGFHRH